MSTRSTIKQLVSPIEPNEGAIGDEWFNPLTNKLYKRVALNGTTVQYRELLTSVSPSVTTTGLTPLILSTNENVDSGTITILPGTNSDIIISPQGSPAAGGGRLISTGNITSTKTWDASAGAGAQLYFNGATGNRIEWSTAGVAAPTFTTRSAGTKIVLYPDIGAAAVDYAIGIESGNIWSSVATTSNGFKWYGGTTLGATLTGAGALTLTSNLTVSGGTITTGNIAATLLSGNTTTNITLGSGLTGGTFTLGGTATTGTMTLDQSASAHTLNIATGATLAATTKTINIGTGGVSTSITNVNIGSSISGATGTTTVNNNLVVSGNLTVNGTTTTVNSTITTIDDPIFTLGGDTAPAADDNKDRGIEFRWHNGTVAKVGFFGFDDSTGKFTFIPDATNTSEVFSGTQGTITANDIQIKDYSVNASVWSRSFALMGA